MNFEKEYSRLNKSQRQAVDQIDGPVMVVAGPGTGKTQLLSMRVANILQKTDVNANNILCLTFTESGASNMTERMVKLFGPDAYKVAVHTFHSFGSEIINHHGQYFYSGAYFQPADDLTSSEVLEEILLKLPHSNPLSSQMNGQFTHLNDLVSAVSALKKSGLTPDEAMKVLDQNLAFCSFATPILTNAFAERIDKNTLSKAVLATQDLEKYKDLALDFPTEPPLSQVLCASLKRAIEEAEELGKTKPLTDWKKHWLEKNDDGEQIITDQKRTEKMIEVVKIYDIYLNKMTEKSLYDFDDMILRVTHALEIFPELKYELQEQYQYVLVDEFQDTNDAQMRLLHALTDYDSRPNIMVVGDDDQAIFRFQGADISNIQSFAKKYSDVKKIVLSENYRSAKPILDIASNVAAQIGERLTNLENLDKTLTPNVPNKNVRITHETTTTANAEFAHIAKSISQQLKNGEEPKSIAVIARRHIDLENLLPYLESQNIPVNYEREQDVLSSPPVEQLEFLARFVLYLSQSMHTEADELLPRILSHPAWGVSPQEIWELSLEAKAKHKFWLEIMLSFNDQTSKIAEWLILASAQSQNETLEMMLDELFGRVQQIADSDQDDTPFDDKEPSFMSPLRQHYFNESELAKNPNAYLDFLSDLTALRGKIREYHPDQTLRLNDFIAMIDTYRDLGKTIRTVRHGQTGDQIQLMTAHKAKGLEFDTVYVINASSQNWGGKARTRSSLLMFPHNMPFTLPGDSDDERIRLLFVALTRTKRQLIITSHETDSSGRELLPLEYLLIEGLEPKTVKTKDLDEQVKVAEIAWHAPITSIASELKGLLSGTLENYKLSATHLNNFIDVPDGGPTKWLMQNLLRFPQAKSPAASFGTAIHTTLQRAHLHLSARGTNKPLEDIIGDFQAILSAESMTDRDYDFYQQKGVDALSVFYKQRLSSFSPEQIVERSFGGENIVIGDARLSGAVDLIDVDRKNKILHVTDYKTGKAAKSWRGSNDYEKIKLHKYRQQLMFYKLLLENSREFSGYTVETGTLEFVEPVNNQIIRLDMTYDDEEMDKFKILIASVWQHIIDLDLPDILNYSADYNGIIEFEKSLI